MMIEAKGTAPGYGAARLTQATQAVLKFVIEMLEGMLSQAGR